MRNRGDVPFPDGAWAGVLGEGLWIESFSVVPLEKLNPGDLEYKGLTATGVESPWVSGGAPCGTKGKGVALVGFAVRVKPQADGTRYECSYSAAFLSGARIGPMTDGDPCVSDHQHDPLEAISVTIFAKSEVRPADEPAPASVLESPADEKSRRTPIGPRFSVFRISRYPPRLKGHALSARIVVNAGCGPKGVRPLPAIFAEWRELRVDIDEAADPDLVADITDLSPIPADSVDAVFASHCMEHLYRHDVPVALREFRRIAQEDGFICLYVPDLQTVAKHIASDRLDDPLYMSPAGSISAHDIVFGHGASLARGQTWMGHRCGFTPASLSEQLRRSQLTYFAIRRLSSLELVAVARKSPWQDMSQPQTLLDQLTL